MLIPASKFTMGSLAREKDRSSDEGPQHEVAITKPFYMGIFSVTQAQWKAVMGTEPWKGHISVKEQDECPATYVSWGKAMEFCDKLSNFSGKKVHLPTEAQREYACRAGTKTRFNYGDDRDYEKLGDYTWYNNNTSDADEDYPHAVGQKKPNDWGLYDMHSNVLEWCSDWYADSYKNANQVDPVGPASGTRRVLRGCVCNCQPQYCRSAFRASSEPEQEGVFDGFGFRVVLDSGVAGPAFMPSTTTAPSGLEFTLGYDTTRITKPLLPDGRPDYLAALNEAASKGVTKENNAALAYLEVLDDTHFYSYRVREQIMAGLGISLKEGRPYFKDTKDLGDYYKALERPWNSKDYPDLAKWLKENQVPLATIREAAKRTRWFIPLVLEQERLRLPEAADIANMIQHQLAYMARGLIIDANLAAGEGRQDEALADLLATHRLGLLRGQDSFMFGRRSGIGISSMANEAASNLAAAGAFSAPKAIELAKGLAAAGEIPQPADVFDHAERYLCLDLITEWTSPEYLRYHPVGAASPAWQEAEPDNVLRTTNKYFDTLVEAAHKPTFAERVKAIADVRAWLANPGQKATTQAVTSPDNGERDFLVRVLKISEAIMGSPSEAQTAADLCTVHRDLAVVALGLCAYKAENGKYSDTLAALSPRYLAKVPEDFCSGKSFIYKKMADGGYILYSVGENMKDDGGKGKSEGGDDIVVKTPSTGTHPTK